MSFKGMRSRTKIIAVLAVLLSLAAVFAPFMSGDESEAAGDTYSYTISTSGKISGSYTPIANNASSSGKYVSSNGSNVGSWGFDSEGYGPFNSFYAAFDPSQNNRMVGHLNPNNLKQLIDGTSISGKGYNIMWCLPTVYWKTDSSENLVLTNDSSAGGTAYAHTINGKTYEYIGIGVYEASTKTVGGSTILTSTSGDTPLVSQIRATFRDYANNQSVNTDGSGRNGYAMVWNFYQWELYKYCTLAVMNGWDSQSIAGNGSVYGGSPYYDTPGLLDASGPYAGTKGSVSDSSYNQDPVKVFIENAWGSVYDFVDGITFVDRSYYIDQSAVPTDGTSGTYITKASGTLPSSNGYGSSPSTEAKIWGMPTAASGSSTSGLYDYVWSYSGTCVLYVGGYSTSNSSNAPIYGLSCALANNSLSVSFANVGGRLAFVFDADPASASTLTFDYSGLTGAGGDATGLPAKIKIEDANTTYPDLNTYASNPSIKAGWKHIGWMVNGTEYAIGAKVATTDSHTAKALWVAPKNIIFDHSALKDIGGSVDGLPSTLKIVDANTTYPDLNTYTDNPSIKAGYKHIGWYVDGKFVQIGEKVKHEAIHTAYSAWVVPQITITFVVEGQEHSTLSVPKGSCGVVYTPIIVEGVFEGWFYDAAFTQKYDSSKKLEADVTLYAKGVPPLEFTSVPTASATITSVDSNGLYYFDATDSQGKYKIEWDFGDGNTSEDAIAYNTYTEPGYYKVTLRITNIYGDVSTAEYGIDVGAGEEEKEEDSGRGIIGIVVVAIVGIVLIAAIVRRVL